MKVKSIQVRYAKKSPQTKNFDHIFDDGKVRFSFRVRRQGTFGFRQLQIEKHL